MCKEMGGGTEGGWEEVIYLDNVQEVVHARWIRGRVKIDMLFQNSSCILECICTIWTKQCGDTDSFMWQSWVQIEHYQLACTL